MRYKFMSLILTYGISHKKVKHQMLHRISNRHALL